MGMHSTYTATHYKDLNIDWQARAVTRHGEDIPLTPQEFALLQVLFEIINAVVIFNRWAIWTIHQDILGTETIFHDKERQLIAVIKAI